MPTGAAQGTNAGDAAAWHALMRDKSLQLQFPDADLNAKLPGWLTRLFAFLGHHGSAFSWAGWIALGIIVVLILWFGIRWFRGRDLSQSSTPAPRQMTPWQPSARQARLLLHDADGLAAQGRFDEAVHRLLLVSIQEITDRQQGTGDTGADQPRDRQAAGTLRPGAADFFRHRAGGGAQPVWRPCHRRCAIPALPRRVRQIHPGRHLADGGMSIPSRNERMPLLLFLVGAAATIALLLLFAYAPDLRGDASNGGDTASRSAIGFAGLKQLLDAAGIPTQIDRGVMLHETTPSLTILTPPITLGKQAWRDYDEHSASLIILPKWITAPMPRRPDWVVKSGAWPAAEVMRMLRPITNFAIKQASGDFRGLVPTVEPVLPGLPRRISGDIQQLQYFAGLDQAELFVNDTHSNRLEKGGVAVLILARSGKNPIYVLSDPDLMNNQGLSDPAKARIALAIIRHLRRGNGPVRMDVTLNGMVRTPSLLKALFEPPFRGATICAFLAAFLMALHALARFGAPLRNGPVLMRGKQALATNTAELVRMMGREAAMAPRYVEAMRNLVLSRSGARLRGPAQQEKLLRTMEAASHSDIRYTELTAAASQDGANLLAVAHRAWTWKGRITSEHS